MPEEQDILNKPLNEEASTDAILQDLSVSPSEPQTKDMEVHHHPDIHHDKKKWREYLLEFLMIFLAVTMGFYAENLREGISESNKAKELAGSLIRNLESDASQSERTEYGKAWREKKLDSLIHMLSGNIKSSDNIDLYYYSKFLFMDFPYHTEDAVFQQIKNSGSLRYFRSVDLQREIASYYTTAIWMESDFDNVQTTNNLKLEALRITSKIFKAKAFGEQEKDTLEFYNDIVHKLTYDPGLLSSDSLIFNQLASISVLEIEESRTFRGFGTIMDPLREKIIHDLKVEYDLGKVEK